MKNVYYRHSLIAALAGLVILALALAALPVSAQSGCVGDPCLFYTPTATVTPTPVNTPGPGTPTPVPMPSPEDFPRPFYNRPTSIPNMTFPNVPTPLAVSLPSPEPWDTPQALEMPNAISPSEISLPMTGTEAISLSEISTSLDLSYSTPLTLNTSVTGTAGYTAATTILGTGQGWVSDTVSYTLYISGVAAEISPTDTFTVATAPDWYAPPLPRPMANVGWTFETVLDDGIDEGRRYSLPAWASFFGYIVSLPVQFIKMLFELAVFLGPLGLFLIWLLVMLPFVLFVRIFLFIKGLFIGLFNLIHKFIRFIGDIWDLVPGL